MCSYDSIRDGTDIRGEVIRQGNIDYLCSCRYFDIETFRALTMDGKKLRRKKKGVSSIFCFSASDLTKHGNIM